MLDLFKLCSTYSVTRTGREGKGRRAHFEFKPIDFMAAQLSGNPAFSWPYWEPWELQPLMRWLCKVHEGDPMVQQDLMARSRKHE